RPEYVIAVRGKVELRPEGMANPKLATGEIEVMVEKMKVLNTSKAPPFPIEDRCEAGEEVRLRYRYLDLRRPPMQRNLVVRHRAYQAVRGYLSAQGFLEIETPFFIRSTPEGARDFLVPSRINRGRFYALPQSPQLYKQILMVAGYDRYFQIIRCFRDEDLRADRQPEFTQIDIEMSFVGEEEVMEVSEGMMEALFWETVGLEVWPPFSRMSYRDAVERYGTDKPDVRFGLELVDVGDIVREGNFRVFLGALEAGGRVKGINAKGGARFSRREIDELAEFVKRFKAEGLAWIRVGPDGPSSPIVKFFPERVLGRLLERMGAEPGDLLLFVASEERVVHQALANLRLELGRRLGLIPEGEHRLVWVVEFPLFERDEEGNIAPAHHPFTSPVEEDVPLLEEDPFLVRARAYDLVWNGVEIGGGSIRISDRTLQEKALRALGIGGEEAREKFGFLLEALEYGAPPHGGIAFGFDRIVAMLLGETSIREVIAFPKTGTAVSLMDGAPAEVAKEQLKELGIVVIPEGG
ncbi:MAG TPA: aspartate--tRNA ligase, partial [Candidatus Latescibacteria bacterium]|nr:aspartate--tRNA ligase [Candidatus Latescibacterota bacterium]